MTTTIIMPQLGETVAEGKILTWYKAVGDDVKLGDKLFEVETDKVTIEVEAVSAGKITDIQVAAGATANIGSVVATLNGNATTTQTALAKPITSAPPPTFRSAFDEVSTPLKNFGAAKGPGGIRISPLARRAIAQCGIDIQALSLDAAAKGLSKIEERHVFAFSPEQCAPPTIRPAPAPAAAASGDGIILNNIRLRTGEKLAENWRSIPHVFQAIDVDFTEIELVRGRHKERFKAETGISLTYLPFIARACCIALQAFPQVNARFDGKSLTLSKDINLGIAVDLNHNGLVVPVVHSVQDFTLQGLAKAIGRQIDKARNGKLTAADFSGGTYSITNNGAFGTSFTTPIINAPQVAILSTDAIRKKPVVISTDVGDVIVPRLIGTVGQSFDHRAFDGAYAAAFLSKLKDTLENKTWAGELGASP
jgi:pyruvate/2-oxoglutarate dehydrogenase complex dihydrolipoamide acyltransferase (E2) component